MQAKVDACSEEVEGEIKELTEERAEEIKKEITDATNNFINTHLNEVDVDADIGKVDVNGKKTGNALASMIKFGYKDYLMLFLFLNVCVNDEAILNRTADVIQLNVDKASTDNGAQYQHAVEDFKMNDACTYECRCGIGYVVYES